MVQSVYLFKRRALLALILSFSGSSHVSSLELPKSRFFFKLLMLTWCKWYFCHTCQLWLWRHWHRLLGTTWQHSRSCFRNFLAANFNKQDEMNSSEELFCVHVLVHDHAFPVRFLFKWMIACRVWRMFWADIREHCSRSNHTKTEK